MMLKMMNPFGSVTDSIPGVGGGGGDDDDGMSKEEAVEQERLRQEAIKQAERERREKYKKQEEERENIRQTIRDKVSKSPDLKDHILIRGLTGIFASLCINLSSLFSITSRRKRTVMPRKTTKMTMISEDQGLQRLTLLTIQLQQPKLWLKRRWKMPRNWLEISAAYNKNRWSRFLNDSHCVLKKPKKRYFHLVIMTSISIWTVSQKNHYRSSFKTIDSWSRCSLPL